MRNELVQFSQNFWFCFEHLSLDITPYQKVWCSQVRSPWDQRKVELLDINLFTNFCWSSAITGLAMDAVAPSCWNQTLLKESMSRQYTLMKLRTIQSIVLCEVPTCELFLDFIHSIYGNFVYWQFRLGQNGPSHQT